VVFSKKQPFSAVYTLSNLFHVFSAAITHLRLSSPILDCQHPIPHCRHAFSWITHVSHHFRILTPVSGWLRIFKQPPTQQCRTTMKTRRTTGTVCQPTTTPHTTTMVHQATSSTPHSIASVRQSTTIHTHRLELNMHVS
jgi:hypothetical protein